MDVVVITKEAYDDLIRRLDAIQTTLHKSSKGSSEEIIDNVDFLKFHSLKSETKFITLLLTLRKCSKNIIINLLK